MASKKTGGTHGKARYARARNRRASRWAVSAIEEFEELPAWRTQSSRNIPIRHRSEFLPTAHDGANGTSGSQVQFAFSAVIDERDPEPSRRTQAPKSKDEHRSASAISKPSPAAPVIRVARTSSAGQRPLAKPAPERSVTLSGLALGCALGSAAALLIVLALRALIV